MTTESPKLNDYATLPDWFDDAEKLFNYVLAVLQFFGLAINLLHLSILIRKDLRMNSVYRLMIGICSCDLFSHILTFLAFSPFWIRESRKKSEECFITMRYSDAFLLLYPVIILDITQRSSSWLALAMALYRTLAVMFPMSPRIQKMSRPRWALWTILGVVLVNTAWSLVVFGRHRIVERNIDNE
uniref:G_PROTEIN_RECEP_F1_2 domain-containing protein n=1 Tax=Caenorhabditis tropicalis TaxID=1561998 RepID=A0A1I7TW02_9PELO